MSSTTDPPPKGKVESEAVPPASSLVSPPNNTSQLDAEEKKALRDAIISILKGIPFIGPYIVVIKLKWGWTGLLLLIGGFMIASVLAFSGLMPESLISTRYQKTVEHTPPVTPSPSSSSSPEDREYELRSQEEIPWDAAIKNARVRVWASGVALRKLNPQLIAEKVKDGVNARLIYLNPCGETVRRRQEDENNPNATGNIRAGLNTFDTYTKDFNESQQRDLQVKLTDVYPTMIVVIIDDDLYAYFCPYGAVCTGSPVLVFRQYRKKKPISPSAKFFEDHFSRVSAQAKLISSYREPCPAPSP
jgi:hypothetical protein